MPDPYAQRYLPPTLSRREFFPALLHELRILADATRGKPTFELHLLAELPDQELATLVPALNAAFELTIDEGLLRCSERATARVVETIPLSPEGMLALALVDGSRSLGAIGRQVATEMGFDLEHGFAHARDLFLTLATRLICVPANPPAGG